MTLHYIGHPFSSYTWKGEIALIEKGIDYKFGSVEPDQADPSTTPGEGSVGALLDRYSPTGKFPLLMDGDKAIFESSIIVEYLDRNYPQAPRLIPDNPDAALHVRLMDRMFDLHLMANMQAVVAEFIPFITEKPDQMRIDRAKAALLKVYDWFETQLPADGWACGENFTMADCAGAPALFYADWVQEIPEHLTKLKAYRARTLTRPSVIHCVEAARPFRGYFPLGAPDRD